MNFLNNRSILLIMFFIIFLSGIVFADNTVKASKAIIVDYDGKIFIKGEKDPEFIPAKIGVILEPGDEIKTGPQSCAFILLYDGSTIKLGEKTHIRLVNVKDDPDVAYSSFKIYMGQMWNQVNKKYNQKTKYEVETPRAVAAVKGTVFEINAGENEDEISVFDGEVIAVKPGTIPLQPEDNNKFKMNTGITVQQDFDTSGQDTNQIIIEADQSARFDKNGRAGAIARIDRTRLTQWQKWNLALDSQIGSQLAVNNYDKGGFHLNKRLPVWRGDLSRLTPSETAALMFTFRAEKNPYSIRKNQPLKNKTTPINKNNFNLKDKNTTQNTENLNNKRNGSTIKIVKVNSVNCRTFKNLSPAELQKTHAMKITKANQINPRIHNRIYLNKPTANAGNKETKSQPNQNNSNYLPLKKNTPVFRELGKPRNNPNSRKLNSPIIPSDALD